MPTPIYLDYYERLRDLDRTGAVALVQGYLSERGDVEGLYLDVLMPAMVHTGREWERDRISVAHEHYISEVTRDLIRQYGPQLWTDPASAAPVAVACCAPGERHALGLLMVSDILRGEGLNVLTLEDGAPAETVRDFLVESRAELLAISCALDLHLPEAADLIGLARLARPNLLVLVGGTAFAGDSSKALALGADRFAADVRGARDVAREIVERGRCS